MSTHSAKSAFSTAVLNVLKPYKELIDPLITHSVDRLGPKTDLRDACAYALTAPAKRFRPAIVYMVAEALGKGVDVSEAALAVEYFHTSSLIADDLPCMDDDDLRRGIPTVHKKWNESIALLASFALIAHGFECIAKTGSSDICRAGVKEAAHTMGAKGLIGGQFLDLFQREISSANFEEIIAKKTGALFDLSFSLGWLFGGGEIDKLTVVHTAALHFGRSFQIIDDIDDMAQDNLANNPINYANAFGLQKAVEEAHYSIQKFIVCLDDLHIRSKNFELLSSAMTELLTALSEHS